MGNEKKHFSEKIQCANHPFIEQTIISVTSLVEKLNSSLSKFSDWKILDEDRQNNLIIQQNLINNKLDNLGKCIHNMELTMVKTYITKSEFMEFSKMCEDRFVRIAKEKMDSEHKKTTKYLIELARILTAAIVTITIGVIGAKIFGIEVVETVVR